MVKYLTRSVLNSEILRIIREGPYQSISAADGRAGLLLENLLGIEGGNHDVADAVGCELKTSINPNTPVTLFHKEALPRGSCKVMVHRYGWPATYKGLPVKSFRATIYGSWNSKYQDATIDVKADNDTVALFHNKERLVHWDSNALISGAAAKLRNMMLVQARDNKDGTISFLRGYLLETFQPFKFIKAIEDGIVAIEYDARTKPNSASIRNHGTKFRIKEGDLHKIYDKVEVIGDE